MLIILASYLNCSKTPIFEFKNPLHYEQENKPALFTPDVLRFWDQFISRDIRQNVIFRSADFFKHLVSTNQNVTLITLEDENKTVVSLMPILIKDYKLNFNLRNWFNYSLSLPAVNLLGGELIVSATSIYETCFNVLFENYQHYPLIRLHGISPISELYTHIKNSSFIADHFYIYIPQGEIPCHTISLPETFDDYLKLLSKKKRYNLNRQVKLLREYGEENLTLKEISQPEDIRFMQESIHYLTQKNTERAIEFDYDTELDLAIKNLFLGYVLLVNDVPCSLMIGKKFQNTLYVEQLLYDPTLIALSPGTTMDFLMTEALINQNIIKKIDFGYGHPAYSSSATHTVEKRMTILLFQKNRTNWTIKTAHQLFTYGVEKLKNLILKFKK